MQVRRPSLLRRLPAFVLAGLLLAALSNAVFADSASAPEQRQPTPTPTRRSLLPTQAMPTRVVPPTLSNTLGNNAADEPAGDGDAVASLDEVQEAVIQIEAVGTFIDMAEGEQFNAAGRGSGFIIDSDGLAVTNHHVVGGAALLKVFVGGEDEPRNAKILGVSECSDLALIDIQGDGYRYLEWFEGSINVGLDVYAAGFPLGDPEFTMTRGIVAKARASGESNWASVDRVLQHDAVINPGNSGGPLVSTGGQVVGVNYAGDSENNQYFAISRDDALDIIDVLATGIDLDSIGVNGEAFFLPGETRNDPGLGGIWVSAVSSGSPADTAGILPGDIILTIEGISASSDGSMADYCDVIRSHDSDDVLGIEVYRLDTDEFLAGQLNGRPLTVSVTEEIAQSTGQTETTGTTETYDDFMTISDGDDLVTVDVPTAWEDVQYGDWEVDGDVIGVQLAAAPDLDDFFNSWDTPGMLISASAALVGIDLEDLLDTYDLSDGCTFNGREELPEGYYRGFYDIWEECGNSGAAAVILAVESETQDHLVVLETYIASDADFDALDRIWSTFAAPGFMSVEPGADNGSGAVVEEPVAGGDTQVGFITITDDSGLLLVSVPDDWSDISGGEWLIDDESYGLSLSAAPDLEEYETSWGASGMFMGVSTILGSDPEAVLDVFDFSEECSYGGRQEYDDGVFEGVADVYEDCAGAGTSYYVIVTKPHDVDNVIVLLQIQIAADVDAAVVDEILNTFTINAGQEEAAPQAPAEEAAAPVAGRPTATVIAASLNVRGGPGTNYNRVGAVSSGDELAVVGQNGSCAWLQVVTEDGVQGWVSGSAQYVTLNGGCAGIPAVAAPPAPAQQSGAQSGQQSGAQAGTAGKGCYLFQNQLNAEVTVTLTNQSNNQNQTFKLAPGAEAEKCLDPARWTYTLDAPPPWNSVNGELRVAAGDNYYFPIQGE